MVQQFQLCLSSVELQNSAVCGDVYFESSLISDKHENVNQ